MREIKFKAWTGTEMFVNETWEHFSVRKNGQIIYTKMSPMGGRAIHDDVTQKWVVMQYTGLKDVNGVEIYEGDIIENHFRKKGVVECVGDRFSWIHGIDWGEIEVDYEGIKVIGNVYENPELLPGVEK